MNLHKKIMNLRCDVDNCLPCGCGEASAYKYGHRDARHSAAELALSSDALLQQMAEALNCLLDGTQNVGEMQWCGDEQDSPWERARAALRAYKESQ